MADFSPSSIPYFHAFVRTENAKIGELIQLINLLIDPINGPVRGVKGASEIPLPNEPKPVDFKMSIKEIKIDDGDPHIDKEHDKITQEQSIQGDSSCRNELGSMLTPPSMQGHDKQLLQEAASKSCDFAAVERLHSSPAKGETESEIKIAEPYPQNDSTISGASLNFVVSSDQDNDKQEASKQFILAEGSDRIISADATLFGPNDFRTALAEISNDLCVKVFRMFCRLLNADFQAKNVYVY